MLRTALDSTRHSRHQLLAATWRSISHFSAERTQLDVRRQESPEHGPTSPLVPLSLLPPLLSLANWLLGWRVFSLSLSLAFGFTSPMFRSTVVARVRGTLPPYPNLSGTIALESRRSRTEGGGYPNVRSRRSARRITREKNDLQVITPRTAALFTY